MLQRISGMENRWMDVLINYPFVNITSAWETLVWRKHILLLNIAHKGRYSKHKLKCLLLW